jgi:hypothetical protein
VLSVMKKPCSKWPVMGVSGLGSRGNVIDSWRQVYQKHLLQWFHLL